MGIAWRAAAAAGVVALGATGAKAQVAQGLELGLEGYGYRYAERVDVCVASAPCEVKDKGRFFGGSVEYGRTFGAWTLNARLDVAGASVDYSAPGGTELKGVEQMQGQLEILVGRRYPTSPRSAFIPYVGIGARALDDYSGGRRANTGEAGYDRTITYSYVPVGAAAVFELPRATLALYGQYNAIVGGRSRSELGDVDPELPTVEVGLDRGHGVELGAKLTTAAGRGRIGVQPFLRTWKLRRSESFTASEDGGQIEFFEPPNRTWELGLRFVYGF
jgi:hypothetical protein